MITIGPQNINQYNIISSGYSVINPPKTKNNIVTKKDQWIRILVPFKVISLTQLADKGIGSTGTAVVVMIRWIQMIDDLFQKNNIMLLL